MGRRRFPRTRPRLHRRRLARPPASWRGAAVPGRPWSWAGRVRPPSGGATPIRGGASALPRRTPARSRPRCASTGASKRDRRPRPRRRPSCAGASRLKTLSRSRCRAAPTPRAWATAPGALSCARSSPRTTRCSGACTHWRARATQTWRSHPRGGPGRSRGRAISPTRGGAGAPPSSWWPRRAVATRAASRWRRRCGGSARGSAGWASRGTRGRPGGPRVVSSRCPGESSCSSARRGGGGGGACGASRRMSRAAIPRWSHSSPPTGRPSLSCAVETSSAPRRRRRRAPRPPPRRPCSSPAGPAPPVSPSASPSTWRKRRWTDGRASGGPRAASSSPSCGWTAPTSPSTA